MRSVIDIAAVDGLCRRAALAAGVLMLLAVAGDVAAQTVTPFSAPPGGPVFSPPPLHPAPAQAAPRPVSPAALRDPHPVIPAVAAGKVALAVAARFWADGPYIPRSLHWRVFVAKPEATGPMVPAGESTDPFPVFALAPGDYIVHAAYGLAGATQTVTVRGEPRKETLVIPGGGLRLQAKVGEAVILPIRVKFDIHEGSFLQRSGTGVATTGRRSDRTPVARSVLSGDLVLLPAGTYYVQSTYGEGNAVIQADVRIEAGRLTEATVHHRAAQITLKLVNTAGGEAIANTSWSVTTPGGDSIKESIGAFPNVVLAEGEYIAVARHDGKIYQSNFKVQTGRDREIEVLAR